MKNIKIKFNNFNISNDKKVCLIAGPCQLESEKHALKMAESIKKICDKIGINLIYKT